MSTNNTSTDTPRFGGHSTTIHAMMRDNLHLVFTSENPREAVTKMPQGLAGFWTSFSESQLHDIKTAMIKWKETAPEVDLETDEYEFKVYKYELPEADQKSMEELKAALGLRFIGELKPTENAP